MSKDQSINSVEQRHIETRHEGERLLARKLKLSKTAIFFERLWLRLWAPATVIMVFAILTLFDLWSFTGPLVHRLLLALFLFVLVGSLIPLLSLRWPSEAEALKRLDKNSTLPHQPAQAFKDHLDPTIEKASTRTLWLSFKERLVEKIRQLKVTPPQPSTATSDPYAIRMLLMLTLVAGLFFQYGNVGNLFNKAIALPAMTDSKSLRIDAWVTPPDYTGQPPILIADGGRNEAASKTESETPEDPPSTHFKVPENSILTIRINGRNLSHLGINTLNDLLDTPSGDSKKGASSRKPQNLKSPATPNKTTVNENSREFQISLKKDGPLSVTMDEIPLKQWSFSIIEDMPPIIGLIEMPVRAQSGALKLKYRLADDYGIIRAKSRIENVSFEGMKSAEISDEERRPLGNPPEFPLNLPQLVTKEGKAETFKDLTRHPWAGLQGDLYLIAEDEGGNTSKSPHIKLVIPETEFTKPMAKNIIRLRKQLIITPFESAIVARSIYALMQNKAPFEKDLTLYLGLSVAANRLDKAGTRQEKEEVATLLYDLARHVEDGDLSAAERELRSAQDALRKALEENASASELQKRIDDLKKALQKYMQALAKQQNQNADNNRQNPNDQNLNQQDLEQMLKTIEELAKSGAKDLAKQMLSQLQNMLENIETGKNNPGDQNQTAKELEELGKILRQQQELMDKTYQQRRQMDQQNRQGQQQGQQGQRQNMQPGQRSERQQGQQGQQMGKKGQPGGHSLQQQQQGLQEQLQKLLEQMRRQQGGQPGGQRAGKQGDKSHQALDNARDAMGRAQQQLKSQNLGDALAEEGQALDQLRRGMEQMAKQMQKGQPGKGGGKRTDGRDPLGRPGSPSGMDTSESTKVPDEIEIQRAREILRNLQDKLSDPNRPAPEIDYFERLLKRFN